MDYEIKLTHDQVDSLNRILNDVALRYTIEAAMLKGFTGDFAQEQAEERLNSAAKASELIALLMQC